MESELFGVPVEQVITTLAFVGAFATVLAVALPFLQRDSRTTRLKAISKAREEYSREQRLTLDARRARWKPKRSVTLLQTLVDRFNLDKLIAPKGLKLKLMQAGYRQPYAPKVYVGVRVLLAVAAGIGGFLYLTVVLDDQLTPFNRLLVLFGSPVVGFYLPAILVANVAARRRQEMGLFFPDALDLLVICVEAGLSIEAAFQRVTNEMIESAPVLAEEFGLTTAELAFLGDRSRAYENLANRTGLSAAKTLATTLVQAEQKGTSVRLALKVLSQESRSERLMMAERKAAALPAKLTVPMIVFFLPVLLVVIMGPAIIQVMEL